MHIYPRYRYIMKRKIKSLVRDKVNVIVKCVISADIR